MDTINAIVSVGIIAQEVVVGRGDSVDCIGGRVRPFINIGCYYCCYYYCLSCLRLNTAAAAVISECDVLTESGSMKSYYYYY